MAHDAHRNPAPAPIGGKAPVPTTLDANGFDPTEFDWRPVPRRPRRDGWTPDVQQRFIAALARTGVVERACEAVNRSVASAYALRNAPGGEGFARAWHEVLARAADRLLDIAFEHAIEGEEVPIFDCDGIRTGSTRRFNTRMTMFILRAYFPERFRHANRDGRSAAEPAPPPAMPVPAILQTLEPVPPVEPHLLAAPKELGAMAGDARARAEQDEACEPEPFRHRPVPNDHPRVIERARRNAQRRAERDGRLDDALGLNLASTSDDPPPRDPLSDYTYWAEAEAKRAKTQGSGTDDADLPR